MTQDKRELPNWFIEFKKNEETTSTMLDSIEVYGKGVSNLFPPISSWNDTSPSYNVNQIDKELELYTLHEAANTDGIGDILKGILTSPLLPTSINKTDSLMKSKVNSGLVCYVQPKISDDGELLPHNIELQTELKNGDASDLLIIIAKTGSKLNLTHTFVGGENSSVLLRQVILLLEDGAMVNYKENINSSSGSIYLDMVSLVGPASSITFSGLSKSNINLRLKSEYYLLGEGSNCLSEIICVATSDSKYDISSVAYLKTPSSHATLHAACAAYDKSHIIYRDGLISEHETNGSVDEAKVLIVGDDSRADLLPIKNSGAMRHVTQSHMDKADIVDLKQFFGRIISTEVLNKVL